MLLNFPVIVLYALTSILMLPPCRARIIHLANHRTDRQLTGELPVYRACNITNPRVAVLCT